MIMNLDFQIVYTASEDDENDFHWLCKSEALAMRNIGIAVGTKPSADAKHLMYRGTTIKNEKFYPTDPRFLNTYSENANYLYLSKYYPHIEDLSIDTFFVDDLNETVIESIKQKGWSKAFIKKDLRALEHIEEGKSVWPNTSIGEMNMLYDELNIDGKYAIRKFIEPEIMEKELRYWVFNGRIYRRDNIIPDIVKKASVRLNKLGSKYYTIDATPEMIIEVNPGESSDRHGENSAELFASWIKKEFGK